MSLVWVGSLWSIRGGRSHDECWLCYFMLSGPCGYNDCRLFRQITQKREQRDKTVMTFCGWPHLHSLCLMIFLFIDKKWSKMQEKLSAEKSRTDYFGTTITFIIEILYIWNFRNVCEVRRSWICCNIVVKDGLIYAISTQSVINELILKAKEHFFNFINSFFS